MTNEQSCLVSHQSGSLNQELNSAHSPMSQKLPKLEINTLSPVNLEQCKHFALNTSHEDSTCSSSSSSSISPASVCSSHTIQENQDTKHKHLKRPRDNSTDTQSSLNDFNNKETISRSSPVPPPCKAAKMGYSIMNLLAKDKKENSNKENSVESIHSTSTPLPEQNVLGLDVQSFGNPMFPQHQSMNPFLMNPFLAAAAAAAAHANNGSSQTQNGNPLTNPSLLNNISNFALLSNLNMSAANSSQIQNQNLNLKQQQQNSNEFWPWFNMAAMSALYGLDSELFFSFITDWIFETMLKN